MAGNKRTTALGDALSKAGAYILVDKNGWPEALKFPANQLVIVTDLASYLNKTSDLISQAEAEAGESNTAKAWSSLRVRQATEAWYSGKVGLKSFTFEQYSNQDEDFTIDIDGNSRLFGIDFNLKSGSPIVKIGTTEGGDDILYEQEITEDCTNTVSKNMREPTTFYVSISGGVVDIMLVYVKNYWTIV